MIQENFIKIYEKSFKKNWELPALTDYSKGTTFSLKHNIILNRQIQKNNTLYRTVPELQGKAMPSLVFFTGSSAAKCRS
mgnify:CR=1 FL=1